MLVAAAGYAAQRGTTCAVSAAVELVELRRPSRLLGFLFCAALALALLALGRAAGVPVLDRYVGHPVERAAIAGGALFGIGAWVNGRCAFGTIARLGSGDLARLGALAGFLIGAWIFLRGGMAPARSMITSPLVAVRPELMAAIGITLAAALGIALRQLAPPGGRPGEWSPLRAMALIGGVNGALLLLAQGWPYTNLLLDIAGAGPMEVPRRTLMSLIFVAGAVIGAVASGSFAVDFGTPFRWLQAIVGGALMGFGATLVPGGNDTMLLVGLPLLLPNLIVAYLAMMAVLILTVALVRRFA